MFIIRAHAQAEEDFLIDFYRWLSVYKPHLVYKAAPDNSELKRIIAMLNPPVPMSALTPVPERVEKALENLTRKAKILKEARKDILKLVQEGRR